MMGDVSNAAAAEMGKPEVEEYFTRLIQRVAPKSWTQALAEVTVTRRFLANFSADQVQTLWESACIQNSRSWVSVIKACSQEPAPRRWQRSP